MPHNRGAISSAGGVATITGTSWTNLGTAGTAVSLPANTHTVEIYAATTNVKFAVDAQASAANSAFLGSAIQHRFMVLNAGSVSVAAASGSGNIQVNWLSAV